MARQRAEVTAATELKIEQIVRHQLLDLTNEQIGERMGMKPDTVGELIRHRKYREIRDRVVGEVYKPIDQVIQTRKANQVLEDLAPEASQALAELLARRKGGVDAETGEVMAPLDPVDIRLTATAVLDRAGYGPVQRKAIRQRIELDPVMADLFARALRESDRGRTIDVTPIDVEDE